MVENMDIIDLVDRFGEHLRDRLKAIEKTKEWGKEFTFSRPKGSDYYRAQPLIEVEGDDGTTKIRQIRKNSFIVTGHTYFNPAYSSTEPLKIMARFGISPGNPIWDKKVTQASSQIHSWTLTGNDVFVISYDKLGKALSNQSENDLMEDILQDLRQSWFYSNEQHLPQESYHIWYPPGTVAVTLDIDTELWNEFCQLYSSRYRPCTKHPTRKSYAELRHDAVNNAFRDYVDKCKRENQAEDR